VSTPRNQPQYQIRFDWGVEGAQAIAPGTHILVWVDALPDPADRSGSDPATLDPATLDYDGAIITGSVGSRDAIAAWVLERQVELGDRAVVAVVAAGGPDGRFAVEDLLAAGAVIDALAEVGIDYISPEAAAAVGAYAGLRNATGHVLSACVTGQELIAAAGTRDVIAEHRDRNDDSEFAMLRGSLTRS
jgi:hypothetical protein